jgi:hypothetical protein
VSRRLLPVLAVGAVFALPACGSDVVKLKGSTDTLSADEVATTAEDALEQEVGTRPDITCPEELAKEEGATTRCTLTGGDDPVEYGVTVTVTSTTDGDTRIGVEVDDEPLD